MKKQFKFAVIPVFVLLMLTGCSPKENETLNESVANKKSDHLNVFKGPQVKFGGGMVRSWISVDGNDFPVEIGIEITPDVLEDIEGLPEDDVVTSIPLHLKATQLTPFEHITFQWEPNGHMPPVFLKPHFEIHFFEIPDAERMSIPPYDPNNPTIVAAANVFPDANKIPVGYIKLPGSAGYYPEAGKHWLTSNVLQLTDFDTYVVHGSYNQKHVFFETKYSMDFISNNDYFSSDYAQPLEFEEPGNNYPTKYNMHRDISTGKVTFTLSDFVTR